MESFFRLHQSLAGSHTINGFVAEKLKRMREAAPDGPLRFDMLFAIMFSETGNVMFESGSAPNMTRVTYGECRAETEKLAHCLRRKTEAFGADAVIGLYMDNSRAWIEAFWAILLCGCRPLLMNLRLSRETLEGALRDTGAKLVLTDREAPEPDFSVTELTFRALAQEADAEGQALPDAGSEILLMSSGTSSRIKICAYTADAFRVMIEDSYQIIRSCPQIKKHYRGSLKLLAFLPFYHIFGLVAVYLWFAFFSRTFVLLPDMSPDSIVRTIREHEVTHIFAVPMLWDKTYEQAVRTIRERGEKTLQRFEKGMRLAGAAEGIPALGRIVSRLLFREVRQQMFGGSIRFMISGGSEIRPEVLTFMNRIGYPISNGYGMTEIGITSVELDRHAAVRNSGSVGRPFSSVRYRVDDQGQLHVLNPGMAYRIMSGGQWRETGDEWFATGDLAEETDGHYRILGRMDDLVISPTGENLNPTLIEKQLGTELAEELCLIGVPGENGTVPTLVARPREPLPEGGAGTVKEAIAERLREQGLDRQIGRIVLVREPLMPPDEIKLNRSLVRKRLAAGGYSLFPTGETETGGTELKEEIRTMFAAALNRPPEEITDGADFFLDGGGSSLDYFDLAFRLHEKYGIDFPADSGSSLNTVGALADYIEKKVDGRG